VTRYGVETSSVVYPREPHSFNRGEAPPDPKPHPRWYDKPLSSASAVYPLSKAGALATLPSVAAQGKVNRSIPLNHR